LRQEISEDLNAHDPGDYRSQVLLWKKRNEIVIPHHACACAALAVSLGGGGTS
jgi:hypothetical protein